MSRELVLQLSVKAYIRECYTNGLFCNRRGFSVCCEETVAFSQRLHLPYILFGRDNLQWHFISCKCRRLKGGAGESRESNNVNIQIEGDELRRRYLYDPQIVVKKHNVWIVKGLIQGNI